MKQSEIKKLQEELEVLKTKNVIFEQKIKTLTIQKYDLLEELRAISLGVTFSVYSADWDLASKLKDRAALKLAHFARAGDPVLPNRFGVNEST